jgi:hypothetical protein
MAALGEAAWWYDWGLVDIHGGCREGRAGQSCRGESIQILEKVYRY